MSSDITPAHKRQLSIVKELRAALHALIRAWPGGISSVSFAGVVRQLQGVVSPIEWKELGGPPPEGRCGYEQFEPNLESGTPITKQEALEGINAIRNSIIGAQTWNWSEHGYPLVSLLDRAGFKGLPYPEAKKNIGTLIERADKAEAEVERLLEALKELNQ